MNNFSVQEVIGAVSAAGVLILAFLAAFRKVLFELLAIKQELDKNGSATRATEETARRIHKAQIDQAELDTLRRFKAAFDTIAPPEWHEKMNTILNGRRLRASDSELVQTLLQRYQQNDSKPEE